MYAIKFMVVLSCLTTPVICKDTNDEDSNESIFSKYVTLPEWLHTAVYDTWENLFQSDDQETGEDNGNFVPSDIADPLKDVFSSGGAAAAKILLSDRLDEWKEFWINIGVTGDSGTGKSSLVNALRGLNAGDEGAAPVGVVETTKNPKSYEHPDNPKLLLWDLPGVGTPNFTRENYFDEIQLRYFDYFIIVTSSRFTDNDKWLITELDKRNKRFYFVRTKISFDIQNDKKDHPDTHNPQKVCDAIRTDIKKNLNNLTNDVYLIDTHDIHMYDFKKLSYKLVVDAPELKREAMLFTLISFSEDMIEAKKTALKERIHAVSVVSAIAGALPIPGLDVAVDIGALVEETKFYKEQFGLTEEEIRTYASKMKLSVDELTFILDLQSKAIQCTTKGITAYMVKKGAKKMAKKYSSKILKYILPGFGSIACGAVSYYTCSTTLESLLDEIADDALKIARYKF